MRVTSNTFTSDLLGQLSILNNQQSRLQREAATGQRISAPGDDPAATGRVLNMQMEATGVSRYQKNIATQQRVSQASFEAMQSLKKISDRAGEIATLADGLKSPLAISTYAKEVEELTRQAVEVANSKSNGSYLFGGTRTDQAPFTLTKNPDGTPASVTYSGNTDLPETEIAEGVTLSPQTLGANTTGSGPQGLLMDSRSGVDLLNHLISLQQHLSAGDTASIASTDRALLEKDESSLIQNLAATGAVQSRLEAAASVAQARTSSLEKAVSGEMDADLAQTLVKLGQTQTAYQAALQTGGSVLKLSLLDYLR